MNFSLVKFIVFHFHFKLNQQIYFLPKHRGIIHREKNVGAGWICQAEPNNSRSGPRAGTRTRARRGRVGSKGTADLAIDGSRASSTSLPLSLKQNKAEARAAGYLT